MGLRSGLRGPVINEINIICPKKIYSVSSCMRGGAIMLKNQDVGVVREQRNDVISENVIAVPLVIKLPSVMTSGEL